MKTQSHNTDTVHNLRMRQKKIIAALDFSSVSEEAAVLAAQFAQAHGSELILFTVIEKSGGIAEWFRDKEADEKHRARLVEKLEALAATFQGTGVKVSVMVAEGKPYRELVKASENLMAEMIVMGTSGNETGSHNYIGSNVYSVVRMANCPVVTLNHNSKAKEIRKILVPVDPGFGIRELRVLMELYQEVYQCEIGLVSLIPEGSDRRADVEAYLRKQAEALQAHGIKNVHTLVVESREITKGVLNVVTSEGYDIIWLETHGRSGISNLLEGSVTEELLFYSPVPVLSLRPVRETLHTHYYHSNLPI